MGAAAAKYVIELVGRDAELKKTLDSSGAAVDSFTNNLARNASVAASALAPIAAGLTSINAIANQVTEVSSAKALADSLDVSVTSLRAWQYAARTTGVEADKMGDIMKDVADKIGDYLTTGGGEAADAIEALNIPIEQLINKRPDQLLETIFGRIAQVNDPNQRAFLLESFADEAVRLQPLLENNAALLRKLKAQASASGFAVSDADAVKVKALGDAYKRLEGSIDGANAKAAVWAGESLSEPVNDLAEVITFAGSQLHLLDEALIVGAGIIAGRYVPALRAQLVAMQAVSAERVKQITEKRAAAVLEQRVAQQNVERLQSSQRVFDAERKLEQLRFDAQISQKGRNQAAARFGEIRKAEIALSGQLTDANKKLQGANNVLAASNLKYAQTATIAGRAANFFKSSVSFLGGPLGVAVLAATAMYSLKDSYEETEKSTTNLKNRTDELYASLSGLSLFKTNELIFAIDEQIVNQGDRIGKASKAYRDATATALVQADRLGQSKEWVTQQTEKESAALSKEQAQLVELEGRYAKTKQRLDDIFSSKKKFTAALEGGSNGLLPRTGGDDGAAKRLKQQQDQSASYLAQLDLQFADEQQKLQLKNQARLQKIEELQLSELEIKRRGFEGLEALKEEYRGRSDFQHQTDRDALALRQEEAAQRERDRMEQEFQEHREHELRKMQASMDFREAFNGYWIQSVQEQKTATQQMAEFSVRSINRATDGISGSIAQTLVYGKSLKQGLAQLALGIAADFVKMFIKIRIQEALTRVLGKTGFAAKTASEASAQVAMSGLNAFASTAAIPVVGPALAPAAASAAIAASSPLAATAISAAASGLTYHTGGIAGQQPDNFSQKLKYGEVPAVLMREEEVLTTSDPRHRNNLVVGGGVSSSGRAVEFHQHNHFYGDGSTETETSGDDAGYLAVAERMGEVARQVINEEQMPGGLLFTG